MKGIQPPKLPLKLFRSYCSEERLEELEGDLYEVFQERIAEKGTRFASLFYWWLVIRSFRSFALKRTKMDNQGQLLSIASLSHNIKIAWRNIIRRKTTTAINVIGLAIGIGGFVAIYSLVSYELSFNKHLPDRDKIYRIHTAFGGAFSGTNPAVAIPIPDYLEENASIIESLARVYTFQAKVKAEGVDSRVKKFDLNNGIAFVDERYFNVIDQYDWLAGTPKTSLDKPNKLVLTQEQGEKYFGKISPLDMIGREVVYRDSLNVTVSGVVLLKSERTDFDFTDLISFSTIYTTWVKDQYPKDEWTSVNSAWQVFVKLHDNVTQSQIAAMNDDLNREMSEHESDSETWHTELIIQPLDEIHYSLDVGIFDHSGAPTDLKTLNILLAVAIALLSIAIFNFINLETAQAINKSKEVGLRKSLGVSKPSLIARFLTESILVTFLAALVSLPISYYGVTLFSELVPDGFSIEWSNPLFWFYLFSLVVIVGSLAGLYPAFVASSYSPVQALKSTIKFSGKSGGSQVIRKVLITSQFVFSQLLVICTLAIVWQISYMLDKELGFKDDGVIYFRTPTLDKIEKLQVLVNEIKSIPQIPEVTVHQNPPARNGWSTSTMKFYDKDSTESVESVHQKKGDEHYFDVYQLELIAGRNVRKKEGKLETVINETYAKTLGYENVEAAIGAQVSNGDRVYEVVGILKDFHFQSLHVAIEPLMYTYDEDYSKCIGLSVPTKDLNMTINKLTDVWNQVYPDDPLEVKFMDETVESFYEAEKRTSKVAGVATVVAILISCLGLFGLISYNILQKSKEVGIRKVLGASIVNIGTILSKEFLMLILVAFLIAIPVAYFLINNWMEDFTYKTNISWWIYGLGGFISIAIALLSIGLKIWKASDANPVDSLRYE
ncbi:ABC transporter permease [Ekhidna sp.]|uniref:ABC transporter permease n=1 Tax=Ekhidna sp. TaxID=2608089 RepID=UPI003CCB8224